MFSSLLSEILNNPEIDSISKLFVYIDKHPTDRRQHYKELKSLHLTIWDESSKLKMLNSYVTSNCIFTRICIAFSDTCPNSPLTLNDFNLLKFEPKWTHSLQQSPILNFSLQTVLDTLEGLDWLISSDIWFKDRTVEWMNQCTKLVVLLEHRVHFFITNQFVKDVLNISHYVENVSMTNGARKILHIDSDEDEDKEQKIEKDPDRFKKYKRNIFCLNVGGIIDLDTLIVSIYNGLRLCRIPKLIETKKESLKNFRQWIFSTVQSLSESVVLDAFSFWYSSLIITKYHTRSFQRRNWAFKNPRSNQVLAFKNFALFSKMPKSFLDMTTPQHDNKIQYLRVATDAMLMLISKRHNNVLQSLLQDFDNKPRDYSIAFYRTHLCWLLRLPNSPPLSFPSFSHAFVHLRREMIKTGIPSILNEKELDIFDKYF